MTRRAPDPRPRVGVSACLLGRAVRYDGGHRRSEAVAGGLAARCTLVEVCPEVELGLGVPRPTLHLVGAPGRVRMVTTGGGADRTLAMTRFAGERVRALAADGLDGFVLKARSPSCGLAGVPVLGDGAEPRRDGTGLFAAALLRALPHLPVVEAEALEEEAALARFLTLAVAHRRWRDLAAGG